MISVRVTEGEIGIGPEKSPILFIATGGAQILLDKIDGKIK